MIYMIIFIFVCAFLLGSIPTALLVVKAITGKDLRKIGSGNIGGTNASRAADTKEQKYLIYIATAVGDVLKGFIPVLVAVITFSNKDISIDVNLVYMLTALAAILGHDTMPFIKNGQGKGVATTFGALVLIVPIPALIGFIAFFGLRLITPVASRRSITSAIVISVGVFLMQYPLIIKFGTFLAALLVIITHRENIKRIIKGQE
ncbi:glycerol-3-phosphate acyltransferase [Clostridium swellfunianum]|uniref:glycerol-3-phosphate acyltransferase n=1 Tax=Clostridium swellfunianum TaxID=1367462 RepID=UPI00202F8FE2|nr:glycerol-3-phosphate acyltransferase [Clostridium swellfunianum]MCM0648246.1 glycerol-3-phosphate acyltransferase [Clostridium swellfunianum]